MGWMGTYKLWSGSSCTSTTSCFTAAALFCFTAAALFRAMAALTFFFEGVSLSSSSSSSPLLARTEDTRSDCLPALRFLPVDAVLAGLAFFFLPAGVLGVEAPSPLPAPAPPTSLRRSFCRCCLLSKRC